MKALFALLCTRLMLLSAVPHHSAKSDAANGLSAIAHVGDNINVARCNFSSHTEASAPPFTGTAPNPYLCEVPLSDKPTALVYVCDGTSHPWSCPSKWMHQGDVVGLDGLIGNVTLRQYRSASQHNVIVYTALLSNDGPTLPAMCTCDAKNGHQYTMKFVNQASCALFAALHLFITGAMFAFEYF